MSAFDDCLRTLDQLGKSEDPNAMLVAEPAIDEYAERYPTDEQKAEALAALGHHIGAIEPMTPSEGEFLAAVGGYIDQQKRRFQGNP